MYSCLYRLFAQFFALSYVNFEGCDVYVFGCEKFSRLCASVWSFYHTRAILLEKEVPVHTSAAVVHPLCVMSHKTDYEQTISVGDNIRGKILM